MKQPANPIKVKQKLDKVGCGFCLAKWTQLTLHLGSGINHSCHHVKAHKIDLDELKNNPNALHNTGFKKEIRRQMLNNERPGECDYCWRIEDNTDNFSDRIYKSADFWSWPDFDTIKDFKGYEDFYPRYVEVSFGNVCNFKCAYCGPPFSSKWTEEVKAHGPYKVQNYQYNLINQEETLIPEREHNPYIEAFWKWFPDALPHMHTFRITGGEPLLSKHTFKVIQFLLDNPQPNLIFAINSNGCPPKDIWQKFTGLIKKLEDTKSIKEFTLYTSAESIGPQAEYSRYGMNWQQFQDNIDYFARNTLKSKISFMSAFNIFSLPTFKDFLIWILYLKAVYHGENRWNQRVLVDIPYVRNPAFLDIKVANQQLVDDYLRPALKFMEENTDSNGFKPLETAKLKRIVQDVDHRFTNKDFWQEQQEAQRMFFQFILEYDRRRGTNFLNTFPQYEGFFEIIKNV